jgi:hypothetical protein
MNLSLAIKQLQEERSRLTAQLGKIDNALAALNSRGVRRRRKISAASIARVRAAQKARWAKWRKQQKSN